MRFEGGIVEETCAFGFVLGAGVAVGFESFVFGVFVRGVIFGFDVGEII